MPETPKQKDKPDEPVERNRSSWSEDQQKRGYYYDDAHGYETYEPGKDEEDDQSKD